MKDTDIMLDLETLGFSNDVALVQVGACRFVRSTGEVTDCFERNILVSDCLAYGAKVDAGTEAWWRKRGGIPDQALAVPIPQALGELIAWTQATGRVKGYIGSVWCQGPHFDIAKLDWWFDTLGFPQPWEFWRVKDCRTVRLLAEEKGFNNDYKAAHTALADCKVQVQALHAALKFLGVS